MTSEIESAAARGKYHHGDLREALLEAAEAELAEKGVEGFTLRGCAKRAGVSHAAPAHHFRDANALLTELASIGFARFTQAMNARLEDDDTDRRRPLIAAGLGYVDFALANPALFGLMFSSFRPDFNTESLGANASRAFQTLLSGVRAVRGADYPEQDLMRDVSAAWAMVHGLAGLLLTERMKFLSELAPAERDAVLTEIIGRSVPEKAPGSAK